MLDFITTDESTASFSTAWRLTGFNRENTDAGRLYLRATIGAGATALELFRRRERNPADLVASGSGGAGPITLNAENTSGLSGSCELTRLADGDGMLIVFYATDTDLDAYEDSLASLLDGGGAFAGGKGFERFTALAKRFIDDAVRARLRAAGFSDESERMLAAVVNPQALAEPAALLTLSLIHERLAGAPDGNAAARARVYRARFAERLAGARLTFAMRESGGALLSLMLGDVVLTRA